MSDQAVLQWARENPHFCTSPFAKRDFRIHPGGFNKSCCCNLDVKNVDSAGSAELVNQVQQAVEQKKTHSACWRCQDEETRGHISERIFNLLSYDLDTLKDFEKNGVEVTEIEVGAKFSNLCNLACRSCTPYESSTYEKITKFSSSISNHQVDISENPENWNQLLEEIQSQHGKNKSLTIHPIGGETFIQPGFYKLLDWLIEQGIAQESKLRVTTSFATPISDQLISKLLEFKKVELLASIDSVGENYHYVRWPARFDKVERNLDILTALHQKHPDKFPVTGIMPIFSLNNIFYIDDILNFWKDWTDHNAAALHFNTVHLFRPVFLAIDILPQPYRTRLLEILTKCLKNSFFDQRITTSTTYEYLTSTIEILNKSDTIDEDMFQHYLRFTADYDRRTKTSGFHGNKKLFDFLTPEHVEIYKSHYEVANPEVPIYFIYDNKRKI